jgi:hypothetical protein
MSSSLTPTSTPHAIPFNSRHLYAAADKCIYCGALVSDGKLGDEHIIPTSFGGNLILPRASCRNCERITTKIKDHCLKGLLSTARPHLGIRGRQRKSGLARGPVYIEHAGRVETTSAHITQHPGMLLMPLMPFPTAMLGQTAPEQGDGPVAVRIAMRPMTSDVAERAAQFMRGGGKVTLTKGLSAIECYRFIAKIAHAFACATLGVDTFRPYLLNLIRGQQPMFADHFVGSAMANDPRGKHLHELSFAPPIRLPFSEMIVVRVRLFSKLDMPTHYAVVGERALPGFQMLVPPGAIAANVEAGLR